MFTFDCLASYGHNYSCFHVIMKDRMQFSASLIILLFCNFRKYSQLPKIYNNSIYLSIKPSIFLSIHLYVLFFYPSIFYLKSIICPAAKFHDTCLFIKWKIFYIYFTGRFVDGGRFPLHQSVVPQRCLGCQGHLKVAIRTKQNILVSISYHPLIFSYSKVNKCFAVCLFLYDLKNPFNIA